MLEPFGVAATLPHHRFVTANEKVSLDERSFRMASVSEDQPCAAKEVGEKQVSRADPTVTTGHQCIVACAEASIGRPPKHCRFGSVLQITAQLLDRLFTPPSGAAASAVPGRGRGGGVAGKLAGDVDRPQGQAGGETTAPKTAQPSPAPSKE